MPEVVANGARFHFQRMGGGPGTAVFLHGLVMDNLSSFYFTLAAPAAQRAEVLLYDLRGHGKSQRTPTGYGLRSMVADLGALLDALAVRHPVHLVGNSFGGLLALGFAAAWPERTASLVLIDAHRGDEGWGDRMAATLRLEGSERDQRIAESFASWLGRSSARKSSRLARSAEDLVRNTALIDEMRASPAVSEAELGAVRCPVLALYGERSDVRAGGEFLARVLPDCDLRIFPGCSHSVLWEETARVREMVVDWLSAASDRRREAC